MPFRAITIAALVAIAIAQATSAGAAGIRTVDTSTGKIAIEDLVGGLNHPWGMAFLPDGRLLVTERSGHLRILDSHNVLSPQITGMPLVFAVGQGGLLDVNLDPDFAANHTIYLSFSEPGREGASTALARGTLSEGRIDNLKVIFRQEPKVSGGNHFGGRIAFSRDGFLFLTMGERFKFEPAQDLTSLLGKIVRLNRDGTIPKDNPFVGRPDARPEIWSYGHRNVQGAAIEPTSGALYTLEFGPRGGDELNRPEAGKNYGWPVVSWGVHYDGRVIPLPTTRPDLADAVYHWTPVISPSGFIFYTGALFPQWQNNALIGGLSSESLVRLTLEGGKVTHEERIYLGTRIRDVEQGPDGSVYLATDDDDGHIWRVRPQH